MPYAYINIYIYTYIHVSNMYIYVLCAFMCKCCQGFEACKAFGNFGDEVKEWKDDEKLSPEESPLAVLDESSRERLQIKDFQD